MKLRRSMTALAGAAALVLGGAPGALAQDEPDGLYGEGDPTYDGVWRQSATILALTAAGQPVPEAAVTWLTGQQCEDGSFPAYRPDATGPCGDAATGDTNATALAIQALAVLGDSAAVAAGAQWLEAVRNDDGGWPYTPGDPTDANSTAVVIGGLAAAGEDTAEARDALRGLQLDCAAGPDSVGGYAWQPDPDSGELFLNESATVDAVLASYDSGLAVEPAAGTDTPAAPACEDDAELTAEESPEAGAARLAAMLEDAGQFVANPFAEGAPDFGATSRAVLALTAGGFGGAAAGPLAWLEDNHTDWDGYDASPGALAQLILAAHAGGTDPADFGGTDLPAALTALGPAADDAAEPTPGDEGDAGAEDDAADDAQEDDDSPVWLLWLLGVGLLAGIGIGLLASLRRRRAADGDADADEHSTRTGPVAATGGAAAAIGGSVAATGGAAAGASGGTAEGVAEPGAADGTGGADDSDTGDAGDTGASGSAATTDDSDTGTDSSAATTDDSDTGADGGPAGSDGDVTGDDRDGGGKG